MFMLNVWMLMLNVSKQAKTQFSRIRTELDFLIASKQEFGHKLPQIFYSYIYIYIQESPEVNTRAMEKPQKKRKFNILKSTEISTKRFFLKCADRHGILLMTLHFLHINLYTFHTNKLHFSCGSTLYNGTSVITWNTNVFCLVSLIVDIIPSSTYSED